jgi:predicted HicB family RNase H-like nuclease
MPAAGWRKPDGKSYKLNVPVDEELKARLLAAAEKRGVPISVWAREILTKAVEEPA